MCLNDASCVLSDNKKKTSLHRRHFADAAISSFFFIK